MFMAEAEVRVSAEIGMRYLPGQTLRPGIGSMAVGFEGASVLDSLCWQELVRTTPMKILDLGIGSGVLTVSLLAKLSDNRGVRVFGVDVDKYCVDLARRNLAGLTPEPADIFCGDWFKTDTWETLTKNGPYEVVFFNPPYYPNWFELSERLLNAPRIAVVSNDDDGLKHYRQVLPKVIPLLSDRCGSTLFVRLASRLDNYKDISEIARSCLGKKKSNVSVHEILIDHSFVVRYLTVTVY